jgi:hypothetical protein
MIKDVSCYDRHKGNTTGGSNEAIYLLAGGIGESESGESGERWIFTLSRKVNKSTKRYLPSFQDFLTRARAHLEDLEPSTKEPQRAKGNSHNLTFHS